MDAKDEAIIRILERSAKLSSRAIAKRVGLPISTVHRRIKNLERQGVITGYKALIDYESTKRSISAFIFINLAEVIPGKGHIPKQTIISKLMKYPEIGEIASVEAVNFNLVIRSRFKSMKELSAFAEELRSIEGMEEISIAIITEEMVPPPRVELRISS